MAKRDAGTTRQSIWPYVVALSIVLVVLLVALHDTSSDVRQVISSVIGSSASDTAPLQPEEEVVVIEPTAQVTNTPQPTDTAVPTKTQVLTLTPTPTPTVTPTVPVGTPLAVFTDKARTLFVRNYLIEIYRDVRFYRNFHCPRQGIEWSPSVDPLVVSYLADLETCVYVPYPDIQGQNHIADRDLAQQLISDPEIECEGAWRFTTEEPECIYTPLNSLTGRVYDYTSWDNSSISMGELCLFLERNFLRYGWEHWEIDGSGRIKEVDLVRNLATAWGVPGSGQYCSNFDIDSKWCSDNECVVSALLERE